jgi:hypothetical protein
MIFAKHFKQNGMDLLKKHSGVEHEYLVWQ